jgi:ABC-type oligopeptide transport system substrate-binding subunit
MQKLPLRLVLVLALIAVIVPTSFAAAGDADITLTSVVRQSEPVTLYLANGSQVSTFDPQRATDIVSITMIEAMFSGLTDYDPMQAGSIRAEAATEWSVSDDGLTWTFTLRDDIPWVRWDPATDTGEVLRNVTAYDFEYGIKRGCDPRLGSLYGSVVAQIVDGCNTLNLMDINDVTDADYDLVNVHALDDTTLEINLQFPAGYFFSMSALWTLNAVPRDTIEEFGDNWTDVGTIVTNGPFVLDEFVRGVRRILVTNPYYPADMRGPGNIERVVTSVVEDQGTRFALYLDNQVDSSGSIPRAEVQSVLENADYADELYNISDLGVFYFGMAHDKAPFDDVHARRAFSAMVSRDAFIAEVETNRGVPMIHFTPPGMFGAPPINEVGVGYDPDFARQELELAGYPNCEGMPNITINAFDSAGDWGVFLAAAAERELGCDPNVFDIQPMEFSVLLESYQPDVPTAERPNMWTAVWGPDYPDANNWVFDSGLGCESENRYLRPCSEVDDLIAQAARESDPAVRTELYYRIEEMFFGPEGEHPMIPLMLRVDPLLFRAWYSGPFETDGLFGGPHYDWRSIDQEAQLAARGSS